jgi:hypothetical protein
MPTPHPWSGRYLRPSPLFTAIRRLRRSVERAAHRETAAPERARCYRVFGRALDRIIADEERRLAGRPTRRRRQSSGEGSDGPNA